jgi:hypothetical protein
MSCVLRRNAKSGVDILVSLLISKVTDAFDDAPRWIVSLRSSGEQSNAFHFPTNDRVVAVWCGRVQFVTEPRAVDAGGSRQHGTYMDRKIELRALLFPKASLDQRGPGWLDRHCVVIIVVVYPGSLPDGFTSRLS